MSGKFLCLILYLTLRVSGFLSLRIRMKNIYFGLCEPYHAPFMCMKRIVWLFTGFNFLLRRSNILTLFSVLFLLQLHGQHTPEIINYSPKEHLGHPQNWAISQHNDRTVYIANTEGLLRYNGNLWTLHKLNSNKIIRSVYCQKNKIFTGAYGEIGFWENDGCHQLKYYSLNDKVPDGLLDKEEIWHITGDDQFIFFQSFSILLAYDGNKITQLKLPGNIMFLQRVHNKFYIQTLDHGIYEVAGNKVMQKLKGSEFFSGKIVTGIEATPNNAAALLISTNSHGVYNLEDGRLTPWRPDLNAYFSEVQINKMKKTSEGYIVLGTIRDGLLAFDSAGILKFHLHAANGLQNNTVLSVVQDADSNIWLGLDKGISMVNINSPVQLFYDQKGTLGTFYTTLIKDSILYAGTNQGLYFIKLEIKKFPSRQNTSFQLIKGTQGHVWYLRDMGSFILCGHNDGTITISGDKFEKNSSLTGGWYAEEVIIRGKRMLLQGTYTGLGLYEIGLNGLSFLYKIRGYDEPVKKFVRQGDYIWVTSPNTGIARLTLDQDFTTVVKRDYYQASKGLGSFANFDLNFFRNGVYVFDGNTHYKYNSRQDKFVPDKLLQDIAPGCLIRSGKRNDWFVIHPDKVVLMQDNDIKTTYPYALNRDYHAISQVGTQYLLCLDQGYAWTSDIKNPDLYDKNKIIPDYIVFTNSTECLPWTDQENINIAYQHHSFRIYFHTTFFSHNATYTYRLKPLQQQWKKTTDKAFIEFSNLPAGQYQLEIKGINTEATVVTFTVLPPWYFSTLARWMYIILMAGLFFMLRRFFLKKLKSARIKMEKENARLLRERMYQMENDRLIQDNMTKSKDLVNTALHLIQKNEILEEIKKEIKAIRNTENHNISENDFRNIIRRINYNLQVEDDKNLFESNFNQIHESFLQKLKALHPTLSPADLRLAAYLKMNLPSKDIAPLFNISIRGLENKRYRLRKKLGLSSSANMTDYLMSL
jgi:DNA-binding CsgD family transcriptional regulator